MTYRIGKGPQKLLDEFRGDRIIGDTYIIYKDDVATYEVTTSTLGEWCSCRGYTSHGKCKHLQMVWGALNEEEKADDLPTLY